MRRHLLRSYLVGSVAVIVLYAGCASPGKRTAIGAGAGAAGGAGIGAIAGGGKGALIGAGVGALVGGAIGNRLDKQAQELEKVAETKRTQDGILVNLKNDLLFDTGSANLNAASNTQLSQLGAILAKYPNDHINIAGHTDNTGSPATNQALSENRAKSVQDVLQQNGVQAAQVTTQGYGSSKPLVPNDNKADKAKNRRVELYITEPAG